MNITGPQEDVKYCPACKSDLRNIPREEMLSRRKKADGTIAPHTHTYQCTNQKCCNIRFEINQHR